MATFGPGKAASISIRKQKRVNLVAEELKRLITQCNLKPNGKLSQGAKLQETFEVSKGTIRETPKSLGVQGLVSVSTGSVGGGTIVEASLDRTFQFMQSYLFLRNIGIADVYTVRCLFEPEPIMGTVPHLTRDDFHTLEHIIDLCGPASTKAATSLDQRQKDLSFHDILVMANPNPMPRFCRGLINEMTRQLVALDNKTSPKDHAKFGAPNVKFHQQIPDATRARDTDTVHALASTHTDDCTHHVTCTKGHVYGHLVLDSGMPRRYWPLIDDHDDSGHSDHSEDRV